MTIYTMNSALTESQIEALRENAENQNDFILSILRANPSKGYAIFEMIDLTGIHHSSVNRALSSMSSKTRKNLKKFGDSCGRMPVVKLKEITPYNKQTGKTCCTYWYNTSYGKPCQEQTLFD